MPSSSSASLCVRSNLKSRTFANLHLSSNIVPAPQPNSRKSPHKPLHPVLHWFGHSNPPSSSMPPPPISFSSDTMEKLRDALTSHLPALSAPTLKRPPRAAVTPNMPLSASSYFLRGLLCVILPTASFSNLTPAVLPFDTPADPESPGAPIFFQHPHPELSSLDILRFFCQVVQHFCDPPNSPRGAVPNSTKMFCHGLVGFDSVTIGPDVVPLELTHWRGIKEVLQVVGTEVLMTHVPVTSSPNEGAKVLEQKIEETYLVV